MGEESSQGVGREEQERPRKEEMGVWLIHPQPPTILTHAHYKHLAIWPNGQMPTPTALHHNSRCRTVAISAMSARWRIALNACSALGALGALPGTQRAMGGRACGYICRCVGRHYPTTAHSVHWLHIIKWIRWRGRKWDCQIRHLAVSPCHILLEAISELTHLRSRRGVDDSAVSVQSPYTQPVLVVSCVRNGLDDNVIAVLGVVVTHIVYLSRTQRTTVLLRWIMRTSIAGCRRW